MIEVRALLEKIGMVTPSLWPYGREGATIIPKKKMDKPCEGYYLEPGALIGHAGI